MATQSFTGEIQTNGEWESVETLTELTFTSGNTYNFWVGNQCEIKAADFKIPIYNNEKFDFVAGSDTLYIRTGAKPCILAIYGAA